VSPLASAAPTSVSGGVDEVRRPPALEGDLARFVASDVLQFLRLAGASGRLECERGDERVEMAFAHGRPLWASTTGRAVRVGDVLLHRGWAARSALDEALNAQRHLPGRRIGELLRERGVPVECVAASVSEVFRRLVCLLSLWPDGRFRFVPGEATAADDVELELEFDRLLLEGLLQADLTPGTA
jgi:hypothetical protein